MSEFLQLLWQVAGLALLLHIGSPQSKKGNDRLEEKVGRILRLTGMRTGRLPMDRASCLRASVIALRNRRRADSSRKIRILR